MEFKLHFPLNGSALNINYCDALLLTGSCFAEHIGHNLQMVKFKTCINPHGILFNPQSILNSLDDVLRRKIYMPDDLFFFQECWHSWQHHGLFSSVSQEQCLNTINSGITSAWQFLRTAKVLMITFGSAHAYRLRENGLLVGNCHKFPQREFEKVLLDKEELKEGYLALIARLKQLNPHLQIVFTISPVRYIRDGIIENNLSKAILLQLAHELCSETEAYYFPAYEIVIDELRDYRFFEKDLVHPNSMAIDYVWERFIQATFSEEAKRILLQVEEIRRAVAHKVQHQHTEAYKKFCVQQLKKINELERHFPQLNFEAEKACFELNRYRL